MAKSEFLEELAQLMDKYGADMDADNDSNIFGENVPTVTFSWRENDKPMKATFYSINDSSEIRLENKNKE